MRTLLRGLGIALIFWGVVIIVFGSTGVTGFVIVEDIGISGRVVLGTVFIAGGVVLLIASRYKLRHENNQAHEASRWAYRETHGGRDPSARELREYTRGYHERDEIGDLVEDWKHRRRRAA